MLPVPVPFPESVSVNFSGLVTPRIVKSPCTSKVSGPVCTTFFERKVINGLCFTSKKSLPFSLPSFMPLPVFTLSAWILTSKTAVVTSGDVKARVASHLSKVPPIATDAFTKNLIELSSRVTTNTGTCALPRDGRAIAATRQRILNLSITPLNPIVDTRHLVLKILQCSNFHLNWNRLQSPCYFDQFLATALARELRLSRFVVGYGRDI